MPESGEWFSPRTRPEMLSSDDPPERPEKPAQILPGPGSLVRRTLRPAYRAAVGLGRAVPALGRAAAVVPAIGRRLGIDHPNSRQRAGIWATGTAVVAATGLAVAAALGGAPAVVSQQFDRLSVLPGLGDASQDAEGSGVPVDDVTGEPATRADGRVAGPADARSGSSSTTGGSATSYGYSLPGVPAGAPLPAGVTGATTVPTAGGPGVPAMPAPVRTTRPAPGVTTAPGGGTTTAPPPVDPTADPTVPPVDPTTDPPVEPTTPPVEPTTPPPPEDTTPPDSPPTVDPPADDPPADEPVADPPADDPPAEGNTPSPDAQPPAATPTP